MFGDLFKRFKKPEPIPGSIRDTLFGDQSPDGWGAAVSSQEYPWSAFAAARGYLAAADPKNAIQQWRQVLATPGLESRHYLQSWHFLRQHGEKPNADIAKEVLGVVVEVGMPKGLDLLAAYPEHSARYYNYSGAGVVWEHPDPSLDSNIDSLLAAAREVVARISPWDKARPAPPPNGQMRLCFLTPSGLHFGQAPIENLAKDPLAAHVVQSATELMLALMAKTKKMAQHSGGPSAPAAAKVKGGSPRRRNHRF